MKETDSGVIVLTITVRTLVKRGANAVIAELRDCSNASSVFSAKNNVVLINLLMLGGLGACSPRKILNFVTTEEICNL